MTTCKITFTNAIILIVQAQYEYEKLADAHALTPETLTDICEPLQTEIGFDEETASQIASRELSLRDIVLLLKKGE